MRTVSESFIKNTPISTTTYVRAYIKNTFNGVKVTKASPTVKYLKVVNHLNIEAE